MVILVTGIQFNSELFSIITKLSNKDGSLYKPQIIKLIVRKY